MINIILCGANGKMGHVIDECVLARNDSKIICGIDINDHQYSTFPLYTIISDFKGHGDVIVDFSHPSALNSVLDYAIKTNTPLVAAATGYSDKQIELIQQAAKEIPIFHTFNMSIGVNLLVGLAKKAATILRNDFDIEIIEKHHNLKVDAPSGTAIMLANAINESAENAYKYQYDRHSKRQKRDRNEIGIHSVRGGTIVGEHEVIFAGRDEVITLSHSAMSKDIFAVGALNAAKFLTNKKAGLYDMNDVLKD